MLITHYFTVQKNMVKYVAKLQWEWEYSINWNSPIIIFFKNFTEKILQRTASFISSLMKNN